MQRSSDDAIPTVAIAGLGFARWTRHQAVDHVFATLARGAGGRIGTLNLDYLRRCADEPGVREVFERYELLVADGMPLLWAAKLQGTPLPDRVAGSDLVWLIAERAASEGRSLYLLGGADGAAEGARDELLKRWPTLRIAGLASPRVAPDPTDAELDAIAADLAAARPDVVYVAFGAPKEERVVSRLAPRFPATWFIGVGVSLGFIAGQVERAPLWVQKMSAEWLHRMVQEPGKLARRYLVDGLPFALRLLAGSAAARWRTRRLASGADG